MFEVGSKMRLLLGLLSVFFAVSLFNLCISFLLPQAATGATIALMSCTVIYFLHRWHMQPPVYDRELQDLRAIVSLSPLLKHAFFPFRQWAMEPGALLEILSIVQSSGCKNIVECGSGSSTVLLGNLLRQQEAGHLYSLEDNEAWYHAMTAVLSEQELHQHVTLIHAPLKPFPVPNSDADWYDREKAEHIVGSIKHIDLLLVDGPKSTCELSRFPALPFFRSLMDEDTLVILDDAKRSSEQAVLERWQDEFNIEIDLKANTTRGQGYVRFQSMSIASRNGQGQ